MSKVENCDLLSEVLPHYGCSTDNSIITRFDNGLINTTYLVESLDKKFVLQRINKNVFQHPEQVINNAEFINSHLLIKKAHGEYLLEPIVQLPNNIQQTSVIINGEYWRAIKYIPDCYTVESVSCAEQAAQVASAFAQFTAALSDLSATKMAEIIPDFHNLSYRIKQLNDAIETNHNNRLNKCKSLVEFCQQQKSFINEVATITTKLPIHVTHNDTKINNLLFSNQTKKPIAVIDLDTCMPGYLMNDFGDMVRTCCSTIPEDGKNLEKMSIRMDVFIALANAYIGNFKTNITSLEKQSLIIGAQLLPFMVGVRFLTDYLNGDSYFQTKYSEHNLDRAKNQLHLYKLLKEKKDELSEIIAIKLVDEITS